MRKKKIFIVCGALVMSPLSCGAPRALDTAACGAEVGVSSFHGCDGESCPGDPVCTSLFDVSTDAELAEALAVSAPGACVRLAGGSYGAVDLPGGASLLGVSADTVHVAGLIVEPGEGSVVRGVQVGDGGVALHGASGALIEAVRVVQSGGDGISIDGPSSVVVRSSEILDAGRYGLYAVGSPGVEIDRTTISGAQASGVWADCGADDGCDCEDKPALTVRYSIVQQNRIVGFGLWGAQADLECVDIGSTAPGLKYLDSQFGGGVCAASCSDISANRTRVDNNADWGILIDHSTARLGGNGPDDGIEVRENLRGMWFQDICADAGGADDAGLSCVHVEQAAVDANQGVGIGVSGDSHGIIFCRSSVTGTKNASILSMAANGDVKTETMGDAIHWLDGSQVKIEGLVLQGNERGFDQERPPILLDALDDGSLAQSFIHDLSGSDAQDAIELQRFNGTVPPSFHDDTVTLTESSSAVWSIALVPPAASRAQ